MEHQLNGSIFLDDQAGGLVRMSEVPYDSEDRLQELLARYPSLLAGDQMDPEAPRRWLLVQREQGIPGELDGSNRWSVDHLFLDQDAIPTLVEVKRSADPRIRREVIGQMLDYAANAILHWPMQRIRANFEAASTANGQDPNLAVEALEGLFDDVDSFWAQVQINLQAGNIRLVFVADIIPAELRRVVEFLNEQMSPAEVFAVEVRQYLGEGRRTLVSRVLGSTMAAKDRKSPPSRRATAWTRDELLQDLRSKGFDRPAKQVEALLGWARAQGLETIGGTGGTYGSLYLILNTPEASYKPFCYYASDKGGSLSLMLDEMGPLFGAGTGARASYCNGLSELTGYPISPESSYPGIPLSKLDDSDVFQRVLSVFQEALGAMRGR